MNQAGLEPAPEREKRGTWAEFPRTHWEVLGAADFFTVERWKWGELVRYPVLFVIRPSGRPVHVAGIVVRMCPIAWTGFRASAAI
ncbi:MAG: hypothetical protein GWO24_21820 [Akkermansiaceae bacterium]|nr:hypothetical protein [Akkermansiaceae bacterium]